jgi:hypothetical protein
MIATAVHEANQTNTVERGTDVYNFFRTPFFPYGIQVGKLNNQHNNFIVRSSETQSPERTNHTVVHQRRSSR